jgi:hypothetical protein
MENTTGACPASSPSASKGTSRSALTSGAWRSRRIGSAFVGEKPAELIPDKLGMTEYLKKTA